MLGVTPLAPGFPRFRVAPTPVDLAWARGIVPTIHGDIEIAWERDGERVRIDVSVPEGTEAVTISGAVLTAGRHRL